MLMKIISFNIGVELGQILALAIMLIVLTQWRKLASFAKFSKITNHALMFAGFMLLLMQLHGYLHTTNEEDFGFNKDAHQHIHLDMDAAKAEAYQHDEL